jgi:RNA-directed DNA polymerase
MERGLRLSEEKTKVTHIQEGFDFLGQTIRKFKDKLLNKPSVKSVKAILDKIRDICNRNKQAKTEDIINQLNPIIRGWANYHRHATSSATFSKVDREIFQILWKWAKRRHPNKSRGWVKRKYFKSHRGNNWTFSGPTKDGTTIRLLNASRIKIKRHIKIKQDANPFDPAWEIYFEKREKDKLLEKWKGKLQYEYIIERQNHLCAHCQKELSEGDEWEYHFKQPWTCGGSSQNSNLIIVHSNCHECLHVMNDYKLGP